MTELTKEELEKIEKYMSSQLRDSTITIFTTNAILEAVKQAKALLPEAKPDEQAENKAVN